MLIPVAVGVFLVFVSRLLYHRLHALLRERGRLRESDTDHLGLFLATVGVAIGAWFALGALLGWEVPLPWRLAAIGTGYLMADGAVAGIRRG
ncbi:MAG: hypothetical protein HY321_12405 [Armatimonadetes bacterium]|nr:hypothetical protein [Armatimonadota bacterium]